MSGTGEGWYWWWGPGRQTGSEPGNPPEGQAKGRVKSHLDLKPAEAEAGRQGRTGRQSVTFRKT